jgi:AraC-like DNA-binding protein
MATDATRRPPMMDAGLAQLSVRLLCCRCHPLQRWSMGNLSAPYWRLYWNASAGASIALAGRTLELTPDRIFVIPPDTPYTTALERPVTHLYIHFVTTPGYRLRDPGVFPLRATTELRRSLREARALIEAGGPALRLTTLALRLVHAGLTHVPVDGFEPVYADARVLGAVSHILARLADRVSNDELAVRAHMNPNAFIRLFRVTTGLTPQAYLARARVERACVLLHYTDRTIDDIAEATGFCDRYHLSHTFQRLRGMGPATFRRMVETPRARLRKAH